MTKMKPEDTKAAEITFGVEIETAIPISVNVPIGGYHRGEPVGTAYSNGVCHRAPAFRGMMWKAERDGSLMANCPSDHTGCEFVSPVLSGDEGVQHLLDFLSFLKAIGAKVTKSCGLHVHVGVHSVIGGVNEDAIINYLAKLSAVCQRLGLAFYAQTGTDRHRNIFCQPVMDSDKIILDNARNNTTHKLPALDLAVKYRLLNVKKYGQQQTVEFRAFAGTLNPQKVLHHLATCLGACRYAAAVKKAQWGVNTKNWWTSAGNGENALRLLWAVFGWQAASSSSTHAFGLFGKLYSEFASYHEMGLKMAKKFDTKFPGVVLSSTTPPLSF